VLLQREGRIQHRLHALDPIFLERLVDALGVGSGLFHDVIARLFLHATEQGIVLAEVGMAQHVGSDQYVLGLAVAVGEIGTPRIARHDHLEDVGITHAMLDQLIDVAYAERPVWHPHRQAIDCHLHHETGRHGLELDRKIIQSIFAGERFDLVMVACDHELDHLLHDIVIMRRLAG